jgi:hypothetical protein
LLCRLWLQLSGIMSSFTGSEQGGAYQ